jgi:hypothetical protein
MTTLEPATAVDYGELSSTELAKLINDEYGLVLSSERTNLKRAKAIGEKLTWLQTRATHGNWQSKLKAWCPKLSYETANRYIRVFEKWPEIEKAAAVKNVVTTDLTIDAALKLLAKPPDPNKGNGSGNASKSAKATKSAVEPANEPARPRDEDIARQYLKEVWEPDELITVLREVRGAEYLAELSAALVKALKPEPEQAKSAEPTHPAVSADEANTV